MVPYNPQAAPKVRGRYSPRAGLAIASALLLVAGLVWAWRSLGTSSADNPPSMVVLPFANLSGDPAQEYFAAGLTGEITDELARLKSLKVLARTFRLSTPIRNYGDVFSRLRLRRTVLLL